MLISFGCKFYQWCFKNHFLNKLALIYCVHKSFHFIDIINCLFNRNLCKRRLYITGIALLELRITFMFFWDLPMEKRAVNLVFLYYLTKH